MLKADQIYYFKLLQQIHKNRLHSVLTAKPSTFPIRKTLIPPPTIHTNYGKQAIPYQDTKILNSSDMKINILRPFAPFKSECRKFLVRNGTSFSKLGIFDSCEILFL